MLGDIFSTGDIYLIREPVSGNSGIPKLHGIVLSGLIDFGFDPLQDFAERYFVFVSKNYKFLLILHIDEAGITLIKRVLFKRKFKVMFKDRSKPLTLSREQMRRMVLDGTYEGEWESVYLEYKVKQESEKRCA